MSTASDDPQRRRDRIVLACALLTMSLLFVWWFHDDKHRLAALLIFGAPPLLLSAGVLYQRGHARFWSGVFALAWFSHAVMVAWSRPLERGFAWAELLLALAVVFVSSAPGLRARFRKSRGM